MEEKSRTILRTIGLTIAILLLASIFVIVLLITAFPKVVADFSYDLGFSSIASSMYHKSYQKYGELDYINKAIRISIDINDITKTILYFEEMSSDKEYISYICDLNSENLNNENIPLLPKSTLINEDNYLKGKYVSALVEGGDVTNAVTFCILNFSNTNFDYQNIGNYLFNFVLTENTNSKTYDLFEEIYTIYPDKSLFEYICSYFVGLNDYYNSIKDNVASEDMPYLIQLCNRIVLVGRNIIKLEENIDIEYPTTEVLYTISSINTDIQGYLGLE